MVVYECVQEIIRFKAGIGPTKYSPVLSNLKSAVTGYYDFQKNEYGKIFDLVTENVSNEITLFRVIHSVFS